LVGTGVEVFQSGKLSYIYRFRLNGRQRIWKIGDARAVPLADARRIAQEWATCVAGGQLPRSAGDATVSAVSARWQVDPSWQRLASGSRAVYATKLRKYVLPAFGEVEVGKLTRRDVREWIVGVTKQTSGATANICMSALSGLLGYAIQIGLVEQNVAHGHKLKLENAPRRDTLSDEEIAQIWYSTALSPQPQVILKLLLLTGCRLREITDLRWDEVQDDAIRIPASRIKTNRALVLPMMPEIASALSSFDRGDGGRVFTVIPQTVQRAMKKLVARTPHAIRRTVASRIKSYGFGDDSIRLILNHSTGTALDFYVSGEFLDHKRKILSQWHNELIEIIEPLADVTNYRP